MNQNKRYPRYILLAGLVGAFAWGLPYPISPFLQLIPFISDFPEYYSPPVHVPLAKLTFSYALAGIIAGGIFLLGIRFLPINRERYSRPTLSLTIVLSTLSGFTFGGALAILVGLLIGSSSTGILLADSLGFGFLSAEPYLSFGWVLGTAIATIIIGSFSGITKHLASGNDTPLEHMFKIALRVSGIALIIRAIICFLQISYLSFATNSLDFPIGIFILFQVVGGAFFGVYTWNYCSRLKAA